MFDFLSDADIYLKTFWYVAMPVSLIFILQSAMTFIGIGDMDTDHDTGGDFGHADSPMELFTLRNMINFLLGFSWGGISFFNTIDNKFLLVTASVGVGVIFVALFFYLIQQFRKLEEDNTFTSQAVINQEAEVYLRIPAAGEGNGKIQVSYNGAVHELVAIAESDPIATGDKVLIIDVLPEEIVLVRKV
ncbi:MAG: NfeD family protein [Saprospiraceae bacterium]|nr:NfeD family protein [Saprospiraceae bacterium]